VNIFKTRYLSTSALLSRYLERFDDVDWAGGDASVRLVFTHIAAVAPVDDRELGVRVQTSWALTDAFDDRLRRAMLFDVGLYNFVEVI